MSKYVFLLTTGVGIPTKNSNEFLQKFKCYPRKHPNAASCNGKGTINRNLTNLDNEKLALYAKNRPIRSFQGDPHICICYGPGQVLDIGTLSNPFHRLVGNGLPGPARGSGTCTLKFKFELCLGLETEAELEP